MSEDKDKRYEREIKELLDRMPEFLPKEEQPRPIPLRQYRASRRFTPPAPMPRLSLSPRNVAIAAFVSLGLSYVVRPITPTVASYLAVVTVALLTLALGLAVWSSRRTKYERRWRGRVITLPSDTPAWQRLLEQRWWRLRMRWRRRRK
ncbi:MAG: hypothetical protein ACUVX1_04875 [Chloroflexota bacterium]